MLRIISKSASFSRTNTSSSSWRQVVLNQHQHNFQHHRPFFWGASSGSGSDNNNNDDKKKDKGDKVKEQKDNETNKKNDDAKEDPAPSSISVEDDPSSSNKSDSNNKKKGGSSSSLILPSRLGHGDESPRYPHLIGLPVISRPLFPGIITSVTLSDSATIDALEKLTSNTQHSNGYVGVFLRKDSPSGMSDGGVILDTPEVITDASTNPLYKVGTFAQIHRLARGTVGVGPSGLHTRNRFGGKAVTTNLGSTASDATKLSSSDDDESDDEDEDKTATLLLLAHRRIDLTSIDSVGPPIDVTVSHWDRLDYNFKGGVDDTIRALTNEILSTIREIATLNSLFREHISFFPTRIDANDPYRLADFAASITTGTPEELQAVLEERDAEMRLHKALVLLSKEREVSKLQQEIQAKVEEKMTEAQRKYFLTEQLKSIKKELGMEKDDKEALIQKYRKKLKTYSKDAISQEVMETIDSEIEKLSTLEKNSSEFNVTRSYLDWLTNIPWGIFSKENFDIRDARKVLDRDHYGLDEVKDTILQFIAVGKLKGTVQGKILCLAGPPGTGKTSIGKSVADALGRKFYRFSVGGLSDVSEIKGHRRTYVGAMPGKLIQCLKSIGTSNPLVLIDEIDKLGRDHRGDPSSALLEVLDPSQNSMFRDHFLDVPVDLSQVLFMCTANDLERIPGPLLDRMEVIRLSGYDVPEKLAIAEQYLVPKAMRENGILSKQEKEEEEEEVEDSDIKQEENETSKHDSDLYTRTKGVPESLSIEKSALESLVRWYCREAGVRNLSKHIDKIVRKLALQIVAEDEGAELTEKSARKSNTWSVTDSNLNEYVGKPIFTSDRMYEKDPLPHGIVMGLAWTSMGGSALYIETQSIKRGVDSDGKRRGGGMLKVTGQLGKVMEESTQISYTVARARLAEIDEKNTYYDDNDIHMHVPEGATPKDGPSAGITMVTAMLSLALDKPIRNDLAMTGEISLTGKVLPVGGIKEKTMAARRAGIKCLIFPAANKRDYDELPDYLKDGLEVHFADDYSTVREVAFGS
mmetsp:Transcript_18326/g.26895  ORF Transcript_18326/g.26895 Transcript_18326/m.26895 type:complete len:1034 (-) Transcript_18326:176-3277(-)